MQTDLLAMPQMRPETIARLTHRVCDHLDIPFSQNRVFPILADSDRNGMGVSDGDRLNAVGRHFGIRYREMEGSLRELCLTVVDSGPVVILPGQETPDDSPLLLLDANAIEHILVNEDDQERRYSKRGLNTKLKPRSVDQQGRRFRWLLVQPMFAADEASRFHYMAGTKEQPLSPLKRFTNLLKPESRDINTIIIFSVVTGLLSLTTPLAVEAIVNTIAFGRYLQPLIVLSLIVFTFLAFRAGLNILMTVVTEIIQRKLFVRTVEDLAYRLTRVPLSTWKKYHGPELVNRFFDIVNVQKITSKLLLDSLMLGLQTVIGLSVLAFYHPFLLGYDIGLLAMMTVVLYVIGRGAIGTAKDESQSKYETAAWLQEIVRHPSTFKYNGGLGYAINRADELAAQYINRRQSHFRILIRQISFAMLMQVVAATILLALGGYLVIEGQMTLGQLVAAELIVAVILGSFAKLGKDLESFYDLMASVDKLGKLFDLPVEPIEKLQLARRPGAYDLKLVDMQLTSRAPGGVDIDFKAGTTYAVYGASELQRGHLVEVMVGQSKPSSGHVLLDEFRVDAIGAESLQEKISLIREIELFEGTVDENLRMGRACVGSAEINDVVSRLGFRTTLAKLPEGLATPIKICGYPLSQGEAIRLVLTRALIAKPAVLFIDGLLDRLSDDDTEDVLQRLSSFRDDTTIIVATGRRAIARWAEQCLDMGQDSWRLSHYDA